MKYSFKLSLKVIQNERIKSKKIIEFEKNRAITNLAKGIEADVKKFLVTE